MHLLNIASELPQAPWKLLQSPGYRTCPRFEVDAIYRLEFIVITDGGVDRVVGILIVDLGTGAVEKRFFQLPRAGEATLSVLKVSHGD